MWILSDGQDQGGGPLWYETFTSLPFTQKSSSLNILDFLLELFRIQMVAITLQISVKSVSLLWLS